jgi:hypothetical protein
MGGRGVSLSVVVCLFPRSVEEVTDIGVSVARCRYGGEDKRL